MFESKFNNSSSIYQLNQQHQLYNLNNSIDSNASYNSTSNSLLTAANTIVFNNSSSLSSNSFTSPSSANQLLSPPSAMIDNNNKSSFTNNILHNYQQNNTRPDLNSELDFDLHFIENSGTNINNETQTSSKSNGSTLFRVDEDDDDDIFINDNQEDDPLNEFDDNDDNTNASIISLNNGSNNRMKEPSQHTLNSNTTSILHNKLTSFQLLQANKSLAVNFPVEAQFNGSNINKINVNNENINDNGNQNENSHNENKKSNISYQNSLNTESLSPSSANNLASTTPSNLTGNLTDSTPQNSVPNKYNRTYMKMQLMKRQTEEMERKEAQASTVNHHSNHLANIFSSSSSTTSNTSLQNGLVTASNNNNDLILLIQNNQQQPNSMNTANQNNMSMSFSNDSHITSSLSTAEIIPRNVLSEVFHIESKLEYPTKYHVMQIAKNLQQSTMSSKSALTSPNKVKKSTSKTSGYRLSNKPLSFMNNNTIQQQFLLQQQQQQQQQKNYFFSTASKNIINNSNKNESGSFNNTFSVSDDIAVLPNGSSAYSDYAIQDSFSNQSFDSKSSSWNQTRSPTSSSFSQNEILSELDDIVPEELNSYLNKRIYVPSNLTSQEIQNEINQIEQHLNMSNTLPNDGMIQIMSPPITQSVRPSTSCPADMARIKKLQSLNLTEDDIKVYLKERQKKDNHNMIERRRRFNINDRIKELGTILPKNNSDTKLNKGSILKASVDYIKYLENQLNRSKEIDDKFRQMTLINRQLINRIKELETKTNSNTNINNNNNIQEKTISIENIKQEPQINIINLINSNSFDSTDFVINNNNNNNSNSKIAKNHLSLNQPFLKKQNMSDIQQQQQQSIHLNESNNDILSEAKILDEILNSPIQNKQNDPFLGHSSNVYDENIMDSFN